MLIFIAFAVMGAWLPVFSRHLQSLRFSPDAMAWASASNAIGAMIAPLIWGQIADRWLAPPRCITLCGLATGVLLLVLARLEDAVWPVIAGCTIGTRWFFLIPLIMTVTGRVHLPYQLEHPERDYGHIRLWGTSLAGLAANPVLTLSLVYGARISPKATRRTLAKQHAPAGAVAAFVAAFYALTVPHAPINAETEEERRRSWLARLADAPLAALQMFRRRAFLVYCVSMFGLYVTVPFTVQLNPLLLRKLEVKDDVMPMYLTLCQTTEILCLALLPALLARFGLKATMAAGGRRLGRRGWRHLEHPARRSDWCCARYAQRRCSFCCFVIAGQVFVNRQASADIRASAQGLLILINGSGLLLGHLLVGWIRDLSGNSYVIAYGVAAGLAAVLLVLFLAGFTTASPGANSRRDALVPGSEIT